MKLQFTDYAVIVLYFIFVIAVGFILKKKIRSSNDFLNSSRNIPLWITSLAFISANLGAEGEPIPTFHPIELIDASLRGEDVRSLLERRRELLRSAGTGA
jgi:hypothetical protein